MDGSLIYLIIAIALICIGSAGGPRGGYRLRVTL